MPLLHNRVNKEEMRQRMLAENEPRTTVSFYRYFKLEDPQAFRDALFAALSALQVFGRIYVAEEGINGQISVPESLLENFREALYNAHPALQGIRLNIAVDDDGKSFWVLKIKVRNKIVADGIDDPNFNPADTGKYLTAADYNALSENPDVTVIDMRNHYEYEIGHFQGAVEIPSDTFREQLPMAAEMLADKKDKPVIMYCTGGIRCEKASAYMKHQGFEEVYHLEGGIIEYARQAKAQGLPVKFIGKNFVFDGRMAERISDDVIATCHQCGAPCDTHTNCANDLCHMLFIQCSACAEKHKGCCSQDCEQGLGLSAEERHRLGIFNKSKAHPLRQRNPGKG